MDASLVSPTDANWVSTIWIFLREGVRVFWNAGDWVFPMDASLASKLDTCLASTTDAGLVSSFSIVPREGARVSPKEGSWVFPTDDDSITIINFNIKRTFSSQHNYHRNIWAGKILLNRFKQIIQKIQENIVIESRKRSDTREKVSMLQIT